MKHLTSRYEYARCNTQQAAEDALEDMFASGEVSAGERPAIERRGACYVITLEEGY